MADPARPSLAMEGRWNLGRMRFRDAALGIPMNYRLVVQPNEVCVTFNLDAPLTKQLLHARLVLQRLQSDMVELAPGSNYTGPALPTEEMLQPKTVKMLRVRRELFGQYLRDLDAKVAGAKRREMKLVLFGNADPGLDDKLKDTMKLAARMRDGGYKNLLVVIDS
jgi:hypothetical protein